MLRHLAFVLRHVFYCNQICQTVSVKSRWAILLFFITRFMGLRAYFHTNFNGNISTKVKSKNCRALSPGNSTFSIQPYTASWITYRRSCTLLTSQAAAIGRPTGLTRKAIILAMS